MISDKKSVVFLYLNGIHHLYHSAITAMELSLLQDDFSVKLISCSAEHTSILKYIQSRYPANRCEIITVPLPFRYKYLNFKKKSYPSPVDTIPKVKNILRTSDAIISTSHSMVKYFKKLRLEKPKNIYQYHGCGDGKYGFDPALGDFDLILLPGVYHQNRLVEEGIIPKEKTVIVGWPKLDYSIDIGSLKQALFNNDRHVVLYAPHWQPGLTSFKHWGREVMEYFYRQDKYNLIFAPHIQIMHWRLKYGYDLNLDKYKCDHIHIDLGSERSVNSAYTKAADLYMGDVSSLVYEWIAFQARPCLFLNAHQVNWREDVNYRNWQYGPVVETMDQLDRKLNEAIKDKKYLNIQSERIKEYMNLTDVPSSRRAAEAIYQYLNNNSGNLNR